MTRGDAHEEVLLKVARLAEPLEAVALKVLAPDFSGSNCQTFLGLELMSLL